jgi:CDP-paratose 2-epimerase
LTTKTTVLTEDITNILITGGCGFVGSNLAIHLKTQQPEYQIQVLDNLSRRGSELNQNRLQFYGIGFTKGDVRNVTDLEQFSEVDLIIDAAAEPSVMAGLNHDPKELVDINFGGTINCLELARKRQCAFIFLSTSRVYSYPDLNSLPFDEEATRFEFGEKTGYFRKGIDETFSTSALKSFYGASKYASEMLINEYAAHYSIRNIINRFGVVAGPHQMGKVDQGFLTLWVAAHYFNLPLSYFGFGGQGKQVRDILHIDDLCQLISLQINNLNEINGMCFNVGGGWKNSISLTELTSLTAVVTGNRIKVVSRE